MVMLKPDQRSDRSQMAHHSSATFAPADLMSLAYYREQVGRSFAGGAEAYQHFRTEGQKAGLNPSPFFYSDWYSWQNPDSKRYGSVLEHFLAKALYQPIDPAPFVDSISFLTANPHYSSMAEALVRITQGRDTSLSPRLEDHLAALAATQGRIHDSIRSHYMRKSPSQRKRLVWVQAGSRFCIANWFNSYLPRSWDLMCNWYSLDGLDLRHGEIHLRQSGTKSTAIYHVLRTDPELFARYEQVLFLDDDLTLLHHDIDCLFDSATRYGLGLFQPALLPGSHCVWPDLFRKFDIGMRRTSGVEIMMPGFSRDVLFDCVSFFGRSISGFGLDFAISEHVRGTGRVCGVIDDVGVGHYSKIDEQSGNYYRLMRALGINQKLELYASILDLGSLPMFSEL